MSVTIPVVMGKGVLAAIISSMAKDLGVTEYTMTIGKFEELNLEGSGIETFGDFEHEDDERPLSFTIKVVEGEQP